jgi:hypothetical protein
LPDVPPELLEQAREDDDPEIVSARLQKLFSYFDASPDTKEGSDKLLSGLAAVVFPAFRVVRKIHSPKRPGRRPAVRPKYEVDVLAKVATAYDRKKHEVNSESTISPNRLYEMFLRENPGLGRKLQVNGKPLELGSFKRLLAVGRSACNYHVMWYKDAVRGLPENAKKSGEYLILCLPGRALHLGIIRFRADARLTCSAMLVGADARR